MEPIQKPLEAKRASTLLVSLSAITLGLVAGSLLILAIGKNPIEGFERILYGALSNRRRIGNTLAFSTQLVLVGLSVTFAFKTGLFNIGGSGQMLIGGLMASIFAHKVTLPTPLHYISIILIAAIAGGAWGFIAGFLKAEFNVHEVVSTIMLNWIAYYLVYDWVPRFIADPVLNVRSAALPLSKTLRPEWLISLTDHSYLNYGFFIAIIAAMAVWFILEKTALGFSLKAVGGNRFCAESAGIEVEHSIMTSMAIAGALAALAGLTYYLGYSDSIDIAQSPSEGFDGIAVALLGASSPAGVFFAALFFALLKMGRGSLSLGTGIPAELADAIIATIIYFTAASALIEEFWNRIFKRRLEKKRKEDK